MSIIFASFGCWNEGCEYNSAQKKVLDLLKSNQSRYKFLIILGDNYYSKKKKINEKLKYNDINLQEMKNGFDCLNKIILPKKLIFGNHDLLDGINQDYNIAKIQLKLPWYDVKFPYGYERHFIDNSESLFLYLDTTIYSLDNPTIDPYKILLGKNIEEIKSEQNDFILNFFKSIKSNTNILIFGHEPLITFRFKNESRYPKNDLIDILFNAFEETKTKYNNVNFYYICADFHNYENAIISKTSSNFIIEQIVLGTGGRTLLDYRYIPSQERLNQLLPYIYNIKNLEPKMEHGYGEFILTKDGLIHQFISIGDTHENNIFLNKYLKYKKKYMKIKKN